MTKIFVTGGTGTLGRRIVRRLEAMRVFVSSFSRHVPEMKNYITDRETTEWLQGDLETGRGLDEALRGIDTVIHTASGNGKYPKIDLDGTRILLARARQSGVSHFVYISVVGADRIPAGYFHTKLEVERLVEQGDIPWSILRSTQFHSLIDGIFSGVTRIPPFAILPTVVNQPTDASEVADRLCEIATSSPRGHTSDVGGPEVLTGREMLHEWLKARRMKRLIIPIWLPSKMGHGLRSGYTTCPESPQKGSMTWKQWLNMKYPQT